MIDLSSSAKTQRTWWSLGVFFITALVLTPVLVIALSWALPLATPHWSHLREHVLPRLLLETTGLLLGVCFLSFVFGVSTAWLCSQYEFPGRFWLRRALVLPLALPAYVAAFVWVGLLDYTGPLRGFLRLQLGGDSLVPEVRSLPGAIVIFSLSLFPYVYVLSYDAFSSQGKNLWEAARSLGASPLRVFLRLALSLARPWIAGGLCLVALEVLNDFGTVSVLGVNTFTTAIYKVWYGFFSVETAAQLASFLILLAFGLYFVEQASRKRRSYISAVPQGLNIQLKLDRGKGYLVSAYLFAIFAFGFGIPCLQLLVWASTSWIEMDLGALLSHFWHSLLLGGLTAVFTCLAASVLILHQRYFPSRLGILCKRLAFLGYGIPGSVLAIGVFLPLVRLDHSLVDILKEYTSYSGGLILTGTLFTMLIALTIRFMAVAGSSIEAGLERVSTRLDESARLFGVYAWSQFRLVHAPLLKRSFASAALLVFVDVVKEMPLTLMTRPFGWDTLSVQIYSLISEGEWQRASVPALLLLLVGLLPLLLLRRKEG